MKRLQASGLGIEQRKADSEVISYENEEIMWQKEFCVMVIHSLYWIQCYI